MFAILNLVSTFTTRITSWLKQAPVRQLCVAFLLGVLSLTAWPNAAEAKGSDSSFPQNVKAAVEQDDSDRPKTTGEWRAEARETEGQPLERAKRIVEESADAVKDWAELYPDVAERTVPAIGDDE